MEIKTATYKQPALLPKLETTKLIFRASNAGNKMTPTDINYLYGTGIH